MAKIFSDHKGDWGRTANICAVKEMDNRIALDIGPAENKIIISMSPLEARRLADQINTAADLADPKELNIPVEEKATCP